MSTIKGGARSTNSKNNTGKQLVSHKVETNYTKESQQYIKQIKQVFRQYTTNDLHTLGLNGFLKFLKDVNLLKKHNLHSKQLAEK